ncbi:COX15/CtaA family protein [Cumulibacter manganitolerans]|uniref:COX15/CtaA family protein n=1 Tax=Cumulibacter manganitolerans TaxID=1884992 RepID=UPI001E650D44|nr:COX15/CtaA family protein [Cumulibacter manganitolerans]
MRLTLPAPTAQNARRLTLANLLANIALVLTGGLVRLTGSGLGCAEWPTCNDGNIVPTPEAPIHTYIEFVNRTLTFALIVVALTTWLVLRRLSPRRPDLTRLAFLIGMGIPAQGVVGGITVLTGLNPYTVMVHMMITMVLIYWAAVSYHRARHLDRVVVDYRGRAAHWLARALLIATYLTLALGTFATGAGPHAGDPDAGRTGFDPALVSQLHADAVFLLVGLSVGVTIYARIVGRRGLIVATTLLMAVELGQAVVGYTQYFTGLPLALVAAHLVLAALVMATSTVVAEELRYVPALRADRPVGTRPAAQRRGSGTTLEHDAPVAG